MRAPRLRDLFEWVERADALLIYYGFRRTVSSSGKVMSYVHAGGSLLVSVVINVEQDTAHSAWSIRGGDFRPWFADVRQAPMSIALEASWFIAVSHGLTPPVVGGRLVTERRKAETRTEPDATH